MYENFGKQQLDAGFFLGNVSAFRDNIGHFRIGLKFTNSNLWVYPEVRVLGIGGSNNGNNYIRALCNLGWRFKFGR